MMGVFTLLTWGKGFSEGLHVVTLIQEKLSVNHSFADNTRITEWNSKSHSQFYDVVVVPLMPPPTLTWVLLSSNQNNGTCISGTNCCTNTLCYGLQYTPGVTGVLTTYTTGFFTDCIGGLSPITSNISCVMPDNSWANIQCMVSDSVLFNSSGNDGILEVTAGVPLIVHQVCFNLSTGNTIVLSEDVITDLSFSIDLTSGGHTTEYPSFNSITITKPAPVLPPNGFATVACVDDITAPTPPVVSDYCGNNVVPGAVTILENPNPLFCEGTRTYSYPYTDCAGNMVTWNFVYTVDETVAPSEMGGPVASSSTIDCGLNGVAPTLLPMVKDACGNVLSAPTPIQGGTYTGACDGTITYTYTYVSCSGLSFVWVYTYTVECFPLTVRVFLEGSYRPSGDSLKRDLNNNHVLPGQDKTLSPNMSVQLGAPYTPFGQPYSAAPWNYNGNTGMNYGDATAPGAPMGVINYPFNVVDWVLVTVRKNGILPAHDVWTCAGWVHTNGNVTFPDACANLILNPMDDYYVLVQHRTHLAVLSPSPVDMLCGGAIIDWDFTTSNSYQPIFRAGQKQIETGIWAMFAANGEQQSGIAVISSQDRTKWRTLQNTYGYSLGDYNMSVFTGSEDESLWKLNQNRTSGIIFP